MDNISELENAKKIFGDNFTLKDLNKFKRKSSKNLLINIKESKRQQKINRILDKINNQIELSDEHELAKKIIHRCLKELNVLHANHTFMQRIIICVINGKGVVNFVNDYWNYYVNQYNEKINDLSWFTRKRYNLNIFKLKKSKNRLEEILNIKVIENDKVFPKEIKIEFIGLETQFNIKKEKDSNQIKTISLNVIDKPIKQIKKSIKLDIKRFKILN